MSDFATIAVGIGGIIVGALTRFVGADKNKSVEIKELQVRVHKLEGASQMFQAVLMQIQKDIQTILVEIEKIRP